MVAPALASMKRDARVLEWCNACRGELTRSLNGVEAGNGCSNYLREADSGVSGLSEGNHLPGTEGPARVSYNSTKVTQVCMPGDKYSRS